MIKIVKNDNLLAATELSIASSEVTEREKTVLHGYCGLSYVVFEQSGELFRYMLTDLMGELLTEYRVFLVYLEKGVGQMSRVRTHKKMFYHLPHDVIKKTDTFEYECIVEAEKSLMTGMIEMNVENFEYCVSHLINGRLDFGYILPKDNNISDPQMFLHNVVTERIKKTKLIRVNILKILASHSEKNSKAFTIMGSGRDEEIIRFYCEKHQQDHFFSRLNAAVLKHRYMEN
jgi:hypothetical protein